MKKLCAIILTLALGMSLFPTAIADNNVDYTDSLSTSAYGGSGTWWDHSDAEVRQEEDYITIKNIDNNSSYSAVDVANSILGGDYANYTAEDYANEYDEDIAKAHQNQPVQTKIYDKLKANNPENAQNIVRTLGKTNHGLFSNRIAVSGQSVKICFTAKFDESGAFVEISNNTGYGPYINTDNGNITVNTGYGNNILLEELDTNAWYTFELVLHDGRKSNPVSSGSVTLYDENGLELGAVDGLQLHYDEVEWYKVNFFPNSRAGAEMSLKDFTVEETADTPSVTARPTQTPYPTLEPTPSPTLPPEGYATPKPTLNPKPIVGAKSENVYTIHEDFESDARNIGSNPKTESITLPSNAGAVATMDRDTYNNNYMTITNTGSGLRYLATNDDAATLITSKAVTQMKVKFNKLSAHSGTSAAAFDLTSSSANNTKSDDTNLVIASRIDVDINGAVTVGNDTIGTIDVGKWYTIKIVSDVDNKVNDVYFYDENGLIGSVNDSPFYNADATGIKNIRFNIKRGSTSVSIDDIYMYELKDKTETVFEDVLGFDAPMIDYLAALGVAEQGGTKITAVYTENGILKNIYLNTSDEFQTEDGETIKTFLWNSISGMKPVSENEFLGNESVTAETVNKMTLTAAETSAELDDEVTREKFYTALVQVYKSRSGDEEPVSAALAFTDKDLITNAEAIGTAVSIGITPITTGNFEPARKVTRYEATQAVSRLISAINLGITNRIEPEPEEEIIIPHVIDQIPGTGVMRDPMVLNAPDGYYYMCCSTGTSPEDAKNGFPNANIDKESLWKDDTGIRVWRSSDLIDWEPVRSAKEDSEYPDYIWNIYEGGTWEKVNGFGYWNINVDGTNGSLGAKRFAQVLWAPEIHWVKGTYFIVYCMNPGGTGIARSVSGKIEGPYVRQESCQDASFRGGRIDASMFWDDDNTVYYTDGSCAIYRMNSEITSYEKYIGKQAPGKEGGFLFKRNGIYYATAGEFDENGGYDAVVGMNKTGECLANGAYGEVHWLYTLGHNGYFEDKDGNWWATMFGNDNDKLANEINGFNNGFALVPIDFDRYTGKIIIDQERLTAWTDLLQQHGYSFTK
ncbi:MAG: family 43 glycosylhydrolase [Clostridia bacterium]